MNDVPESLKALRVELALHHPNLYALTAQLPLEHAFMLICCYFQIPPPQHGVLASVEAKRIVNVMRAVRKGVAPVQQVQQ